MINLSERQEAMLNEAGKLLVKAGYVNLGDGLLSKEGRSAMWKILLEKFEKEILKAATESIAKDQSAELLRNAKNIIANS